MEGKQQNETSSNWMQVSAKSVTIAEPRGVLGISSDGDDRSIILGLKFSIPGFFLGMKIWLR